MVTILRRAIVQFAEAMEQKLRKHDEKRGVEGWLNPEMTTGYLYKRLIQELNEYDSSGDYKEMIDVANIAMMIYDRGVQKCSSH